MFELTQIQNAISEARKALESGDARLAEKVGGYEKNMNFVICSIISE